MGADQFGGLGGCQIFRHNDPDRKSGADGKCRLDVEPAADDLLTGLIDAVGRAAVERPLEIALFAWRPHLGADGEQGGEDGGEK